MAKKRLNVGLLISEYSDTFATRVCNGAMVAAEEMDVNLYILSGGYFDAPYMDRNKSKYEYQNNHIYRFVKKENIDVLIILLGTIASNVSAEIQRNFLESYGDIPIITIANKVEGYTNLSFDNKSGFAKEVEYIIDELGKKDIGIVCGPATNEDAIERLEAYKETLKAHNIEVEDKKIVYGNFTEYSDEAIEELLDNNPDLEAIIFENDHMALGGYRILKDRGMKVGEDICVVGFDDSPFAALMDPPLTTTRADSLELGYLALKEACKIKKNSDKDIRIDTSFVRRKSCGATFTSSFHAKYERVNIDLRNCELSHVMDEVKNLLCNAFSEGDAVVPCENEIKKFVRWVLSTYKSSNGKMDYLLLKEKLSKLNDILLDNIKNTSTVYDINEYIIMALKKNAGDDENKEEFYQVLASVYREIFMISERERVLADRKNDFVSQAMIAMVRDMVSDDSTEDYGVLLSRMSVLGIESSYILTFPEVIKCQNGDKWDLPTKLKLQSYQIGRASYVPKNGPEELSINRIFDISYLETSRRKTYAFAFLFSKDEQYGVIAVEPLKDNLSAIETIAFQVSSAIQTIHLLKNKEDMSAKLAESLEQLKEINAFLDEVSKSDELTQIYNRRGFLVAVKNMLRLPENAKRNAVVIYADEQPKTY